MTRQFANTALVRDNSSMRKRDAGFTLIEMMIVVTIIGILSTLAIPAFKDYVNKARAIEAPTKMMEIYRAIGTYYTVEHVASGAAMAGANTVAVASRCIALNTGYLHGSPYPHGLRGRKATLNWYAGARTLHINDRDPHLFSYYAQWRRISLFDPLQGKPRRRRRQLG